MDGNHKQSDKGLGNPRVVSLIDDDEDEEAYMNEQLLAIEAHDSIAQFSKKRSREESLGHCGEHLPEVSFSTNPMSISRSQSIVKEALHPVPKRNRAEKGVSFEFQFRDENEDYDEFGSGDVSNNVKREVLPKHLRKALKNVQEFNPDIEETIATLAVKQYSASHPDDKNSISISQGALELIERNEVQLVTQPAASPAEHSSAKTSVSPMSKRTIPIMKTESLLGGKTESVSTISEESAHLPSQSVKEVMPTNETSPVAATSSLESIEPTEYAIDDYVANATDVVNDADVVFVDDPRGRTKSTKKTQITTAIAGGGASSIQNTNHKYYETNEINLVDDEESGYHDMVIDVDAEPSSSGIGDNDVVEILSVYNPVTEVLKIFPNAKVSFVESLLSRLGNNVEFAVQEMIEKGFEKESKVKSKLHTTGNSNTEGPSSNSNGNGNNKKEYDFTSSSWDTSTLYRKHALIELGHNFPYFKDAAIKRVFEGSGKKHYYHTVKLLEEISNEKRCPIVDDDINPTIIVIDDVVGSSSSSSSISQLKKKKSNKVHDPAQRERVKNYVLDNFEKIQKLLNNPSLRVETEFAVRVATKANMPKPPSPLDEVLSAELRWLQKKELEELSAADSKMAEELNVQLAEEDGAMLECGCCFSEYPFEALIQCSEGHLFCKNCLKHYVEETVFGGGRSTIKCMSSEGCQGFFPDSMIKVAVPEKVFAKYSEALTRDALKAADINDLVNCHHCQMQVSLPADCGNVLVCPGCDAETCRLCGEEAHIPLKCSEVEKKSETQARLSVEEAMTAARIRECPKCKTRFFKTEGCNKMVCTCNTFLCYVCRKDITKQGYGHFCQTAHCDHKTCGKCKLYTNTLEDDRQAMLEAGMKKMNELKNTGEEAETTDNNPVAKVSSIELIIVFCWVRINI